MLESLVKTFLAGNRNARTTSIPGTRRINQIQILAPTVYKNVSCGNNVRSTVLNNVRESDELDTTIDGPTTNENHTTCLRNVEYTPKRIFPKNIKKLNLSSQMNFTDSITVETP